MLKKAIMSVFLMAILASNLQAADTLYVPLVILDSLGNSNGTVLASGDSVGIAVISPVGDSIYGYKGAYNDATIKTLNLGGTKFPNYGIRVIVPSPRCGSYTYTTIAFKAGGSGWSTPVAGLFTCPSAGVFVNKTNTSGDTLLTFANSPTSNELAAIIYGYNDTTVIDSSKTGAWLAANIGGGSSNWSNAQRDSILAIAADAGKIGAIRDKAAKLTFNAQDSLIIDYSNIPTGGAGADTTNIMAAMENHDFAKVKDLSDTLWHYTSDSLSSGDFNYAFWHKVAQASDSGSSSSSNWSNAQRDSVLAVVSDAGKVGATRDKAAKLAFNAQDSLIVDYSNIPVTSQTWSTTQRDSILAVASDAGKIGATRDKAAKLAFNAQDSLIVDYSNMPAGSSSWSTAQRDSVLANIADAGKLGAARDKTAKLTFNANDSLIVDYSNIPVGGASNWSDAQRDSLLAIAADAGKVGAIRDKTAKLTFNANDSLVIDYSNIPVGGAAADTAAIMTAMENRDFVHVEDLGDSLRAYTFDLEADSLGATNFKMAYWHEIANSADSGAASSDTGSIAAMMENRGYAHTLDLGDSLRAYTFDLTADTIPYVNEVINYTPIDVGEIGDMMEDHSFAHTQDLGDTIRTYSFDLNSDALSNANFNADYWHGVATYSDSGTGGGGGGSADTASIAVMMENRKYAHIGDLGDSLRAYTFNLESDTIPYVQTVIDYTPIDVGEIGDMMEDHGFAHSLDVGDSLRAYSFDLGGDALSDINFNADYWHELAIKSDSGSSGGGGGGADTVAIAAMMENRDFAKVADLGDSLRAYTFNLESDTIPYVQTVIDYTPIDVGEIGDMMEDHGFSHTIDLGDTIRTYSFDLGNDAFNNSNFNIDYWHSIANYSDSSGSANSNWSDAQRDSVLNAIADAGKLGAIRSKTVKLTFDANDSLIVDYSNMPAGGGSSNWSDAQRDSLLRIASDAGKLGLIIAKTSKLAFNPQDSLIVDYSNVPISIEIWSNAQRDSVLSVITDAGKLGAIRDRIAKLIFNGQDSLVIDYSNLPSAVDAWSNAQRDSVLSWLAGVYDTLKVYDNAGRFQALIGNRLDTTVSSRSTFNPGITPVTLGAANSGVLEMNDFAADFWHNIAVYGDSGTTMLPDSIVAAIESTWANVGAWAKMQYDTLEGRVLILATILDASGDSIYPSYVSFRPLKADSTTYAFDDSLTYRSGENGIVIVKSLRTVKGDRGGKFMFPIIPNIALSDTTSLYEFQAMFRGNGANYVMRTIRAVPDSLDTFNPFAP